MPDIPDYDDLKLRIEPGEGGSYRVVAFGPGGSTASGAFSRPISQVELDNFVLRVGLPRRQVRAYRSSQMEEAKSLGTQLFESLLADDVGDLYHGARRVADSQNRGLRVTLYMTGAPELMEIPWEFLYDPGDGFFLSQSMYTPLVRSLDLTSAAPPRKLTLPLKILGLASAPQGFPGLDAAGEREKLRRALEPLSSRGAVELEWLESATLAELDRRVGNPDELHVIHYIGHGAYDERTQSGILVLEDSHGGVHEVTGEELGTLLRDERSLRLVVLNSCEGARTSHVDPFSGVASSLLRCGLPAVVGMQAEITDEAAITFSERLYTALAQGYPIDAALTQARKAIFAAGSDVEFGTPVLFLRGQDARLFDFEGTERLEELPLPEPLPEPVPQREPRPEPEPRLAPEPRPEPGQVPPPPPAARWRKRMPWAAAAVGVLAAAGLAVALLSGGGDEKAASTIRVGSAPIDVVVTAGSVWTSNQSGGDISEVDPARGEQVSRIEIAPDPGLSGIAAGLDSLWVANVQTNRLVRVALRTRETTRIQLEGRPSAVAFGEGRMWVTTKTQPAQLVEIDHNTNRTGRSFEVAANPEDIKFGKGALWVTSASTKTITRVALDDGTSTFIPIGAASDDAAVGAGALWVANPGDDRITRIALGQPAAQRRIRVGRRPEGVAADDRNVWVVNQGDNSVTRIDAHSPYHRLGLYTVGEHPSDVALDQAGVAWVVNTGDNTLSRIEP